MEQNKVTYYLKDQGAKMKMGPYLQEIFAEISHGRNHVFPKIEIVCNVSAKTTFNIETTVGELYKVFGPANLFPTNVQQLTALLTNSSKLSTSAGTQTNLQPTAVHVPPATDTNDDIDYTYIPFWIGHRTDIFWKNCLYNHKKMTKLAKDLSDAFMGMNAVQRNELLKKIDKFHIPKECTLCNTSTRKTNDALIHMLSKKHIKMVYISGNVTSEEKDYYPLVKLFEIVKKGGIKPTEHDDDGYRFLDQTRNSFEKNLSDQRSVSGWASDEDDDVHAHNDPAIDRLVRFYLGGSDDEFEVTKNGCMKPTEHDYDEYSFLHQTRNTFEQNLSDQRSVSGWASDEDDNVHADNDPAIDRLARFYVGESDDEFEVAKKGCIKPTERDDECRFLDQTTYTFEQNLSDQHSETGWTSDDDDDVHSQKDPAIDRLHRFYVGEADDEWW